MAGQSAVGDDGVVGLSDDVELDGQLIRQRGGKRAQQREERGVRAGTVEPAGGETDAQRPAAHDAASRQVSMALPVIMLPVAAAKALKCGLARCASNAARSS